MLVDHSIAQFISDGTRCISPDHPDRSVNDNFCTSIMRGISVERSTVMAMSSELDRTALSYDSNLSFTAKRSHSFTTPSY